MTGGSYALFSAQYPPHVGGIENFTQSLARALVARGRAVTVVTNDTNGLGAGIVDEGGVEVVRLPCRPLVDGRLPLPARARERRALLGALDGRRLDGVLVNARFYPHSLLGMRFAREQGLRPVVLDHGSAYLSFSSPLLDPVVRAYEDVMTARGRRYDSAYYCVSRKSAEWLAHFGIKAQGVIGNAVDARAFRELSSGRDFRRELGLANRFVVAFVGRLIPEKGVAALVAASRDAGLLERGVTFVVAGDGPLAGEVKAACGEGLRWVGPLGRPDVSALLQEADALCLPSRSEGFSTTLLEAAACGCPALATDVGGARELGAALLASADASEVVAGVCRLVDDPASTARLARESRELAEVSFSWDATAEAFERACAQASGRAPLSRL